MEIINEFISFEEAETLTGINKYTLGRVKTGYLKEFIKDKKFNITLYNSKIEQISQKRHLIHCIYYAMVDIYDDDVKLSQYLSNIFGKEDEKWFRFLNVDLFSTDKNSLILNWFEVKMANDLYMIVMQLNDDKKIVWEDYFY